MAVLPHREMSAAGGESVFVFTHSGRALLGDSLPTGSAVPGGEQEQSSADRIPREEAVLLISKGEAVEESLRFHILVDKFPAFSTVPGEIETRGLTGSGAHRHAALRIECLEVAKVEVVASDPGELPGLPAVSGASDPGFRSEPANLGIDCADSADGGRHSGVQDRPRRFGGCDCEREKEEREHG